MAFIDSSIYYIIISFFLYQDLSLLYLPYSTPSFFLSMHCCLLFWFSIAAIKNYHSFSTLKITNLLFHCSIGQLSGRSASFSALGTMRSKSRCWPGIFFSFTRLLKRIHFQALSGGLQNSAPCCCNLGSSFFFLDVSWNCS